MARKAVESKAAAKAKPKVKAKADKNIEKVVEGILEIHSKKFEEAKKKPIKYEDFYKEMTQKKTLWMRFKDFLRSLTDMRV